MLDCINTVGFFCLFFRLSFMFWLENEIPLEFLLVSDGLYVFNFILKQIVRTARI